VVVAVVDEPPLVGEELVAVHLPHQLGEAVVGGDDQGRVVVERVADLTDIPVEGPVEVEEVVLVLAVVRVVAEQEVVDPVGAHEDAEEEVPVVLIEVVSEVNVVAGVERRVRVLDELGLVVVVSELRVHIDPVVVVLEDLSDRVVARGRID